jgi:large exoprotein involved in heme utilization and adhesion
LIVLTMALILTTTAPALAELRAATLRGFQEVPAISTEAVGLFAAFVSDDAIAYTLTYSDLEGGTVIAAHIHLGQFSVNGAIVIHFCGTGGKPACPTPPAVLTATATAADVVAQAGQGIAAGDIHAVVRALRAGKTYVNVHTSAYPGGEIRGQIE